MLYKTFCVELLKMSLAEVCFECGCSGQLMRCTRCKVALYCSKDHQRRHWKKHKKLCKKVESIQSTEMTKCEDLMDDSNERNISIDKRVDVLAHFGKELSTSLEEKSATEKVMRASKLVMPVKTHNIIKPYKSSVTDFPEFSLLSEKIRHYEFQDEMCATVIRDMNEYGVCVIDNFLGEEDGMLVLQEVLEMHQKGVFRDGQLVSNKGNYKDQKTIRSDQIMWISGRERVYNCDHVSELVHKVDSLITRANKTENNGVLGQYSIKGRTGMIVKSEFPTDEDIVELYGSESEPMNTNMDDSGCEEERSVDNVLLQRPWNDLLENS